MTAGDWVCDRLSRAEGNRWGTAILAWRERDTGDAPGLLAWSTGIDRNLAISLIEEGALDAPSDFDDVANDNDELRIAARMAGALPEDQVRNIIFLAKQFEPRDAGRLRILANECLEHLSQHNETTPPFEQGELVARYLRDQLRVSDFKAVRIFSVVEGLGVDVRSRAAEPPTLDGLAIWGSRFGPGVFLNQSSRRILPQARGGVKTSRGARVTLAHELCHLLLDGSHALSAIEVLKARVPAGIEQRVKSFAGEFLLPAHVAARSWDAKRPTNRTELDNLVSKVSRRFGVTRSVAAWKIEHGAKRHYDIDLAAILDAVVPQR